MKKPSRIENPSNRQGKMIVICGSKGGIGKTMCAINLAIAYFKKGKPVALWDGDYQFGDIDISMDLRSPFTMNDVVEGIETLDSFSLKNLITQHKSGVDVLPAPKRPEYADLITPSSILKTGELLCSLYDTVIVDGGTGLNDQNLNLIDLADKIIVLTTIELASIKSTKLMLEIFKTLEVEEKVKLVINRSTMEGAPPINKIFQSLKVENPFLIPDNRLLVSKSLNLGTPLVSQHAKSDVAKAIFKLAADLGSPQLTEELGQTKQKSSIFHFRKKKKRERT